MFRKVYDLRFRKRTFLCIVRVYKIVYIYMIIHSCHIYM